jgi:rhamnosyltransferase
MRVSLCIPVFRTGFINRQSAAIRAQSMPFSEILFIDSSPGGFPGEVRDFGKVLRIDQRIFDHGGTRRYGAALLADADIIVFLTEDAVPANAGAVANLVAAFADPTVGVAFGRQLPRPEAGAIERHARLFNYPPASRVKSAKDIPRLGLKAAFISNSFAAYRREALEAVGGFPEKNIVSEDTLVAARMLQAGWKVAYCAEAQVYHSHAYNWGQEFQRYFDIGVFHARQPWIRKMFGGAEREGLRFLQSEMAYLHGHPLLLFSALSRLPFRYLGFRAGLGERFLPRLLKSRLSMQKNFWCREMSISPFPQAIDR